MIDAEALKRFLETELFEKLVEFYTYSPTTLPRPDFKTVYSWLTKDVEDEFHGHPAKMSPWLAACIWRNVKPSDTVLDPMCGVGGTIIPGLLLSPPRHIILNDIVPEYTRIARGICEGIINALELPTTIEDHATNAATLYEKVRRRTVDVIITSPPYSSIKPSPYHPFMKTYRGGGWGDLSTFSNGHYKVAWLQLLAGFYLLLNQRGRCVVNVKNTKTDKQKIQPLTTITQEHMQYIGFVDVNIQEYHLAYESPYVRARKIRGEGVDHLLKEYVVYGVKR